MAAHVLTLLTKWPRPIFFWKRIFSRQNDYSSNAVTWNGNGEM